MRVAYVDSSCLVAIAFAEAGSAALARTLQAQDVLLSSNLLEAELRAALRRDNVTADPTELLSSIVWVHPDRALTAEITTVLGAGYVRGADLWHLASALFVDPDRHIAFLTLDARQREISQELGFGAGDTEEEG
ncbi:MAG TPA: PIN domain-containing protein [Thermoanaerobaculia bacterium]|nr:PIN domain-containing protein [Thermoanaerobaculia bacterium]